MPRRDDIHNILIIGSGPIVIGQACEFDYSGTQACRVLRSEGYRVVLANSNPATIMTDPDFADRTYVEPLTPEILERIIERERPDAVLPTLGGQTGLNLAMALYERGIVGVPGTPELIGANAEAISTAEDRDKFKQAMIEIGLNVPRSGIAHSMEEAERVLTEIGLPVIIRPAYILGGRGTGIANTLEEFRRMAANGLDASPIHEILIETSIVGWKEYELEVMRDRRDNCVIICSIENLDPMGVHTGDSITVAPAQTLSDQEYQLMRDAAFACIRRVGVETGGSNVQFALNPENGEMVVIEMNPRVSRSSALASKATGFPIAKIAAKLAVGYTLDEIPNDITLKTPASFEPTIDYVVTKIPRWAFEKLPGTQGVLGTQMQSVGEAMAIGRTFPESLQKGLRSLEQGRLGLNADPAEAEFDGLDDAALLAAAAVPTPGRIFQVGEAVRRGLVREVQEATRIDPWFIDQMAMIVEERRTVEGADPASITPRQWRRLKRLGFSDGQVAHLTGSNEDTVRSLREGAGVVPTYKTVDTCSAEFEADTPYHYSTYEDENEVRPSDRERVIILGSGPNRIGQGIEFDYCCVHASFALRDAGYETVMVNCNPETVSTDYDTSDRLYFEPLTLEDVLEVVHAESAAGEVVGVVVQLGGQTPLGLAQALKDEGVPIVGTPPESIHLAEDRGAFGDLLTRAGLPAPRFGTAFSFDEAQAIAQEIGYPVLVRPSYVLGGRGMEIVYDDDMLRDYLGRAAEINPDHPVLVDRFLDDAVEIDVDALYDGHELYLAGVMEHIEEAGIHSGDSACTLPPVSLGPQEIARIRESTLAIAHGVGVRGLLNVQYALAGGVLHVLEANPRASRTVPFVSKATAVPLAKAAARVMLGTTIAELREQGLLPRSGDGGTLPPGGPVAVKEAVLPFGRFHGVDTVLGPEMRSTGEVMGIDREFGTAFAKSQEAAYSGGLPTSGRVFVSVADRDKRSMIFPIKRLSDLGFEILATDGTAEVLRRHGLKVGLLRKARFGPGPAGEPTTVQAIMAGDVDLIINTPFGVGPRLDGYEIRTAAVLSGVPCITTIQGLAATVLGIEALVEADAGSRAPIGVRSLQEHADDLRRLRANAEEGEG